MANGTGNGSSAKKHRDRQAKQAARSVRRRKRWVKFAAILGVCALLALGIVGIANSGGSSTSSSDTTTTAKATTTTTSAVPLAGSAIKGVTPCPATDGSSPRAASFTQAPPTCIDPAKKYTATFDTSEGTVVVPLDTAKTPITANNFVVLALYHYYDGTQIFRTDTTIDILQGGAPNTESPADSGPGYTIPDEGTSYNYTTGDLVMARTSAPNSAGAQFFFAAGDKVSSLNGTGPYVTFGHATAGVDVLQKILGLNVNNDSGLGGAPSHTVTIKTVKISVA